VNAYLRQASGRDVTAKDFRTWAATVEAAVAFHGQQGPPLKKNVYDVIAQVAEKLGNSATICRKCYIHPAIIDAYEKGEPLLGKGAGAAKSSGSGLDSAERAVLRLLKSHEAGKPGSGTKRLKHSSQAHRFD
jgi:DNA topoisomerase-1